MSFRAFVSTILILALKSCGAMSLLVAVNAHAIDKWEDHQRHIFPGGIVDGGAQVVSILSTGARCDDRADDQAAITKAVATLGSAGGTVTVPRGSCYVGSTVAVTTDNVTIAGEGPGSILRFPSSIGSYLSFTDVSGGGVRDLRIEGNGVGTGAFGACVQMTRVTDATIRDVICYDPDDFGFYLIDSDRITVEGNHIIGADSRFVKAVQQPYCGVLDGTGGSTIRGNTCYQVLFGMLSQSVNTEGSVSARTAADARGNTFVGNVVDKMYSHAFSLNGVDNQTVTANTVKHYPLDGDSPRAAYQSKATTPVGSISDDTAIGNVFEANVAEDVDTCFGTNDGSRSQFNAGVCRQARYDGVWLNGSIRDQVNGLQIYDFDTLSGGRACVRVEGAAQASVRGVKCETVTSTAAVGIDVRSSSVNGWYDAVDLIGNFTTCLSIGSGSNNTAFGLGIRLNAAGCTTPVSDATTNSIFPRSFSVQFNAADSGFHFLARPPRGLIVGRVHYVVPATIGGGTPAIAVGQFGSNNKFITSTALTAVTAGTVNSYDATTTPSLGSRDLTAGGYLQVNNTPNSASSGRIGVTVDGIDGPGPVTPTTTTTSTTL